MEFSRPFVRLRAPVCAALALAALPALAVPPSVVKTFDPTSIVLGGASTLRIVFNNPNAVVATVSDTLVDTLPANVVIADTPGEGISCLHGGISVTPRTNLVTIGNDGTSQRMTIPANGSCQASVRVTGTAAGAFVNSIPGGALHTDLGSNPSTTSATLTVTSTPPTLEKEFAPLAIVLGGASTLSLTLGNDNQTAATLTAPLIDNLPDGLTLADPPSASSTCVGGALTATANASTLTLANGAAIPANGTCRVQARVHAQAGGVYVNLIDAGALQTTLGDSPDQALAVLAVTSQPPTVAKSFTPASIDGDGTSTLSITLDNEIQRAVRLTADLTDALPQHVIVADPASSGTTCTGGAVLATPGAGTVTLGNGATIPANGSCRVQVRVKADAGGTFTNTIPAGALQTDNGDNPDPASATLTATMPPPMPPTLSKAFSPASIAAHDISTLTVTLNNPNATPAALSAGLADVLPASLTIATPGNAATTCAGASASAGGNQVTLAANAKIPAHGSCTLTASVTGATAGTFTNTIAAGALQTDAGANAAAASASLHVSAASASLPPSLQKTFTPANLMVDAPGRLVIALYNTHAGAATLIAPLIDALPQPLVLAPTPNLVKTCSGGTVGAEAGADVLTLGTGLTIPSGSCTVAVSIVAATTGSYVNTLQAGSLRTTLGNNVSAASATLVVVPFSDFIFADGFDGAP